METGEQVTCEVGAMIAMSQGFQVETTSRSGGAKKGIMKGIKRMFSGENFFLNHFTANAANQSLIIGGLTGDVAQHQLDGGTLIVQRSSWLASDTGIEIDTTWQGLSSGLFSGEGMFWVRCSGAGTVLISSFGAIYAIDIDGEHVVDSGHIVAFEETLNFKIGKANKSWVGTFMGGEGLICRFHGRGRIYCQSHNPPTFGEKLGANLKPR